MSWNAWGISWGDSWGTSWGPLHEVEENPGQYYGSGKRLPVQPHPGTEDDDAIIRKVLDKWDFIESIKRADAAKQASAAIEYVAEVAHQAIPVAIAEKAIAAAVPAIEAAQDPAESIELALQREYNEKSLALILAAL